ncbi:MAG: flagellar motor switch protein FliG, partial [Syntrophobacterales bacterium]|nr:flagellar motor switch protein FliG [Syntrophobacterales bacterium]
RLSKFMNRISDISSDTLNSVAKDFHTMVREKGGDILVSFEQPRNIVIKALGKEEAEAIMADITSLRHDNPIIDKLQDIDPKVLVDFTRTEHPQTIALIMAHLKPDQAAQILADFSPDMQFEITKRMATLKSVPYELIEEVAKTLEQEIVIGKQGDQAIGGAQLAAEILNRLNRANETAILASLEEADPELADQIRNFMFTFEDVLNLDDKSLQELLREVSSEELAKALKLVEPNLREKIFKNMSKRGAEMLMEDIEMMPPIRLSDAEASQRAILEVTKRLESEGKITISRGNDQDEFI